MRAAGTLSLAAWALHLRPRGLRAGVYAGGRERLERTRLTLGFVPLTDCAPLAVALEKGFFRKHGLDVTLSREPSWANIRDKVAVGALDGAHMLACMPIASTLGLGGLATPMVTAFSLDLNGNAITVSNELFERMRAADPEGVAERPMTARPLKRVIDADRAAGRPPMTFGTVFPYSAHTYVLCYWMAASGIRPGKDVQLTVVPPPQMCTTLEARGIVGYCVGEPWNQRAVASGVGRVLIADYEIWNNKPEKVLGVHRDWAERNPHTHRALIRALLEAAQWADLPEHRPEVARLIAQPAYVNAPAAVVQGPLTGSYAYGTGGSTERLPDFNVFYRNAAAFPWRSHAAWFATQMLRWGQLRQAVHLRSLAEQVYRPEVYREAARELGLTYPLADWKTEGSHAGPWTLEAASSPILMGPDRFCDGRHFDPADPVAYLQNLPAGSATVSLDALARANA